MIQKIHKVFDTANFSGVKKITIPAEFRGLKLCPALDKDTVSFKTLDLLQLPKKKIFEKIDKSIKNRENFIGSGGEAIVYRIDDTDYCVRLNKDFIKDYKKSFSLKLREEDKINHVVARLGKGSSIMKYIEGYPVLSFSRSKAQPPSDEIAKMIAELPEAAFNKLFKQICHAKDNQMIFDCNWTNVIVNPKEKTLTAIDFYKMIPDMPETVRPLDYIFASLVHMETTLEQKKKYAGKLLLAALEELKPSVKPCLNPSEFGFGGFIYKLKNSYEVNLGKFEDILVKTLSEIQDIKIKESNGRDVYIELNSKLNMAKALVNQLFLKST